jgi:hypothetical protein
MNRAHDASAPSPEMSRISRSSSNLKRDSQRQDETMNAALTKRLEALESLVQKNHETNTVTLEMMTKMLSEISRVVGAQAVTVGGGKGLSLTLDESVDALDLDTIARKPSSHMSQDEIERPAAVDDLKTINIDPPPIILVESDAGMINPKNRFRIFWDLGLILPILVYLTVIFV